jgi:hypothetical protein
MDPYTYDLIGRVYAQVERAEPWCAGAEPVAEVGIFTPEEFAGDTIPGHTALPDAIFGATRMLQELRAQFDILSSDRDLSPYKLLILPDAIPVDAAFAAKLEAYLDAGGSLILTHESGLRPDGQGFASPRFGVERVGPAAYSPDFLVPGEALRALSGLEPTGYVMYQRGLEVRATEGSEVLGQVEVPYFERSWRHFCSHRHTPSAHVIGYPGAVRRGNVIYFSHPLFTTYQQNAALWCKKLLGAAMALLLPDPVVQIEGPSTLIAALNRQPAENRLVLHLLHYIPERRGQAFDVIEDVLPVYGLPVSVKIESRVKGVRLVPQGKALPFAEEGGRVRFTVPEMRGYQMVEIG